MDRWLPDVGVGYGDAYTLLADSIEQGVRSGRLKPGERLPTHRELARRLGIAVSTVTRGYAEATRRGLIESGVGRGTFVRSDPGASTVNGAGAPMRPLERLYVSLVSRANAVDLSLNHPLRGDDGALAANLRAVAGMDDLGELVIYQPPQGRASHRAAGAAWLRFLGVDASEEDTIVVAGGQTALLSIFLAFVRRGEVALAESLTWPGALAIAQALGIRLEPVAIDGGGIVPEAFDDACRRLEPRILYTMPTLQNPTTATADRDRREEIARIASKYGVIIVEDDAYGFLVEPRMVPYFEIARASSIYLTSLSKPIAPAMRLGYAAAPPALRRRMLASVRATMVMASPLLAELATRMITDGDASGMARFQAAGAERRQRLADRILGTASSVPTSLHRWLPLPSGVDTARFVADALAHDVALTSGEVFAVSPGFDPHGVRICLCAEPDERRLESALRVVAGLTSADLSMALPVV